MMDIDLLWMYYKDKDIPGVLSLRTRIITGKYGKYNPCLMDVFLWDCDEAYEVVSNHPGIWTEAVSFVMRNI